MPKYPTNLKESLDTLIKAMAAHAADNLAVPGVTVTDLSSLRDSFVTAANKVDELRTATALAVDQRDTVGVNAYAAYRKAVNYLQAFYGEGNVVLNEFGIKPKAGRKRQGKGAVSPS